MQIVIDISEEDLDCIKYLKAKGWASRHELNILSGTPVHMIEGMFVCDAPTIIEADKAESNRLEQTCHTCKHYTSGENDGSCGSYICKGYSNWESEDKDAGSN